MQKQKRADEADPFNNSEQEQIKFKPAELKVPDIHETMKLAGVKDIAPKQKQGGHKQICCCGSPSCSIGPFTITVATND